MPGLIACLTLAMISTQSPEPFQGRPVFDRLVSKASVEKWAELPIGDVMGKAGIELLGTPYVGFTAERWVETEVCSIDLTGLDCVTFYEDCLAFARMLKKGKQTPEAMMDEVRLTRYRGGKLGDYTTRLHYTSDWMFDNSVKQVVEAVTPYLPGAAAFKLNVGYMSANPDKYKQLVRYPEFVEAIKGSERVINARDVAYIPADKVDGVEAQLRTGDILGFTTTKAGLDTSHTGMIYRTAEGRVGVLHASSSKKAVVLEADLSQFVESFATGILVARPLEP